jgi:hypothetical protein
VLEISQADRQELERRVRDTTIRPQMARRALIVLLSVDGYSPGRSPNGSGALSRR